MIKVYILLLFYFYYLFLQGVWLASLALALIASKVADPSVLM